MSDPIFDHGELPVGMREFPLLDALFGRRSRRFGLGMSIPDGPLAYTSAHPPLSLSDLERTLLVLCGAGVSGWHTGMEHTSSGDPERGCNYAVRYTGRMTPTLAGVGSPELIVSDDAGTFMTRFRDLNAERLRQIQDNGDRQRFFEAVMTHTVPLSDVRVDIPAAAPYISPHNFWNANRPGTTLFIPIIDLTQNLLDLLAIYLGAGALPYDTVHDRPCGDFAPFIEAGLVDPEKRMHIFDGEQYVLGSGAAEAAVICHNLVLTMQAMGLGGWMFTGINPPSLLGAHAERGVRGLGFRFTRDARWTQPNPVGLDGVYEAYCPPYHADMREAAQRFADLKFGPGGTYDPSRPGPYRDNAGVKAAIERYTPDLVAMLGEVAQYLHDTYGKFPATIPSIYVRIYAQAQHIDLDYYDQFLGPDAVLPTHREHMARWHGAG
ncbi:MAG: hypothetical protein KC442_19680 [Thermomicrobiales bacterium]|nr:hypothetical protein [Thermomicrobiales bacterium]